MKYTVFLWLLSISLNMLSSNRDEKFESCVDGAFLRLGKQYYPIGSTVDSKESNATPLILRYFENPPRCDIVDRKTSLALCSLDGSSVESNGTMQPILFAKAVQSILSWYVQNGSTLLKSKVAEHQRSLSTVRNCIARLEKDKQYNAKVARVMLGINFASLLSTTSIALCSMQQQEEMSECSDLTAGISWSLCPGGPSYFKKVATGVVALGGGLSALGLNRAYTKTIDSQKLLQAKEIEKAGLESDIQAEEALVIDSGEQNSSLTSSLASAILLGHCIARTKNKQLLLYMHAVLELKRGNRLTPLEEAFVEGYSLSDHSNLSIEEVIQTSIGIQSTIDKGQVPWSFVLPSERLQQRGELYYEEIDDALSLVISSDALTHEKSRVLYQLCSSYADPRKCTPLAIAALYGDDEVISHVVNESPHGCPGGRRKEVIRVCRNPKQFLEGWLKENDANEGGGNIDIDQQLTLRSFVNSVEQYPLSYVEIKDNYTALLLKSGKQGEARCQGRCQNEIRTCDDSGLLPCCLEPICTTCFEKLSESGKCICGSDFFDALIQENISDNGLGKHLYSSRNKPRSRSRSSSRHGRRTQSASNIVIQ